MEDTVSMGLTALLAWLVGSAVLFAMLVAFYPPYLRWRIRRRGAAAGRPVAVVPVRHVSEAQSESAVRQRTFQAPGA